MSIVFETWIGIAFSMTPPWRVWPCGRTCFFAMFRPSTTTLLTCGNARETVPCLPLSLPVMIKTVSPFLIFILARWRGFFFSFCCVAIYFLSLSLAEGWSRKRRWRESLQDTSSLEHFRRKRNDLHKVSFAQFAGHRAKDTCAPWVIPRGNYH